MLEAFNNSIGVSGVVIAFVALIAGTLGAWRIYRIPKHVGPRELGVFTFCYLVWLVGGPSGLGWRYPEITLWFLVVSSAIYLPVLIALALRYRSHRFRDR